MEPGRAWLTKVLWTSLSGKSEFTWGRLSEQKPLRCNVHEAGLTMNEQVIWLDELGMNDVERVGGKNAS